MKRFITILLAVMFTVVLVPLQTFAQDKTVTLVVSGEASTKDEAIKQALRSAIEQAFGTFVSANTTVVNDQITRDEIISVTSGNIQSYKEIAAGQKNDGTYYTSVEAVVSIGKLQTYAQNKGMSTELAGNTLTMNVRLKRLNKENEKKAIENMFEHMIEVAKNTALFDYSITSNVGYSEESNTYYASGKVKISANENLINLYNYMDETVLCLSEKADLDVYGIDFPYCSFGQGIPYAEVPGVRNHKALRLMNDYTSTSIPAAQFYLYLFMNMLNFEIKDNLNHISNIKLFDCSKVIDYHTPFNIRFTPPFFRKSGYNNTTYPDDRRRFIFALYKYGISGIYLSWHDIPLFGTVYGLMDVSFTWSRNYSEEEMNKLSRIEITPKKNFYLDDIKFEDICKTYMLMYDDSHGGSYYKPEN